MGMITNTQELIAFKKKYNEMLTNIRESVARVGVAFSGSDTSVHTIGMAKLGLPDLIVSINNSKLGSPVLAELYEYWRDNGIELGLIAGLFKDSEGNDKPVLLIPLSDAIARKSALLRTAHDFYDKYPEVEVFGRSFVQVFWADPSGKFPHDEGYDRERCKQDIYDYKELVSVAPSQSRSGGIQ
jgi:hypothetical protein